jgi:hypothetical protein
VVEMFGLISALALVYVLTFMVLEKDTFRH